MAPPTRPQPIRHSPRRRPLIASSRTKRRRAGQASRDKDGNIKVKGKAYRSDSRYQAVLGPPEVSGTTASIAPTITQNMTAYGAEDNWWDVAATIPGSAAVDTVTVTCGARTLAELKVPVKA